MTTITVGIDPGASGAIAVMVDDRLAGLADMPTMSVTVGGRTRTRVSADGLHGLLSVMMASHVGPMDTVTVVLEEVSAMPKDGPIQAFAFGRGFGSLEGVITGMRLPRTYVKPAEWKRALKLNKSKDASRQRAMERFPHMREDFARVKDDGRAEAALIAHWWVTHGSQ